MATSRARTAITTPLRRADGTGFVGAASLARARAIAEAVFATEAGPPPAERLDWLMADLEDFLARMGRSRFTFVAGLFALSVLAPLLSLRFASLGSLEVADRVDVLARVEHGPFAFALLGVKLLMSVLYYEHPDAGAEIGFDAECRVRQ